MKDTELKRQRDQDLYDSYCEAIKTHHFKYALDAIDYVRNNTAPRFYISGKTCSLLLSKVLSNKPLNNLHTLAKKRIYRLTKMYKMLIKDNPEYKKKSLRYISEILVNMPAPGFYITRDYAVDIIRERAAVQQEKMIKRLVR